MCGRYRLSRRKQIIEEHFDTADWQDDWSPRYNIAPTQPVPVVRQHPKEPIRHLSLMKWGLITYWSKDPSIATGTINAKSETAATKAAFRDPMRLRRCLIPADAFYEWKRIATVKQPYCFELNGGELFAFAGLWDGWKDASGKRVKTCTILTTTPNAVTSAIHDRMPAILHPDSYDLWLDPGMIDAQVVSELLKPYDAKFTGCYPVSRGSITWRTTTKNARCAWRSLGHRIGCSPSEVRTSQRQVRSSGLMCSWVQQISKTHIPKKFSPNSIGNAVYDLCAITRRINVHAERTLPKRCFH
jgi:putative SOS response-associated peptidase YedK